MSFLGCKSWKEKKNEQSMEKSNLKLPLLSREDPKMFRSYTNTNKFKYSLRDKLDISEIIDMFTSENMEKFATRVPDVVSYEFYEWCI